MSCTRCIQKVLVDTGCVCKQGERRHGQKPPLIQKIHAQISKCHRAKCEFLTLVDVVLDRNSVFRDWLYCQPGLESDDPGHPQQDRTGYQEGDKYPRSAS